jgi:hypothetical protein
LVGGGAVLTVKGTNLTNRLSVSIGGKPCRNTFSATASSGTTITCKVPAGTKGLATVSVQDPDGQRIIAKELYDYQPGWRIWFNSLLQTFRSTVTAPFNLFHSLFNF